MCISANMSPDVERLTLMPVLGTSGTRELAQGNINNWKQMTACVLLLFILLLNVMFSSSTCI